MCPSLFQYVVLRENLYWWASHKVTSDLVMVSFARRSLERGTTYYWPILRLKQPLLINIPILNVPADTHGGYAVQPDEKLDKTELDLQITVYRFMPPPLGRLYVDFMFGSTAPKLRVRWLNQTLLAKVDFTTQSHVFLTSEYYHSSQRKNWTV